MSSGSYVYRLNGELAPIEETWTIQALTGDRKILQSSRRAGETELEVSAEIASDAVQRCTVDWRSGSLPTVCAVYELVEGGVAWSRTMDQVTQEGFLEGDIIIYPLMRVFTGSVIKSLAAKGGEGAVLVPCVSSTDQDKVLLPDVSRRTVAQQKDQHWTFVGAQYDASAQFWLAPQGVLMRYCWQQSESQSWDISLKSHGEK